jgi:hypothetical protein
MLVLTAEEYEANLNFRERGNGSSEIDVDPSAPRILVETPDVEGDVTAPVDVKVTFVAAEGSNIDLGSLKVRYGWFDITDRVLKWLEVTSAGMRGHIAAMKRGDYRIRVSISDDQDRTGKAEIKFRVQGTTDT